MKVAEMKLFVIFFFVILRHSFASDLKEGDWFIKFNLAIGDSTTLQCPFTRPVNCRWRIGDQTMPNSMRYGYLTGNGSNTTDCSIRITNAKKTDLYFWTCEIYELCDGRKPIATLRYYVTDDIYKVHALVEIQNLSRMKNSDQTGTTMCVSNTYVDKCFAIVYFSFSYYRLQEGDPQPVHGNNCTLPDHYSQIYTDVVCGLEKDVQEPQLIKDDTLEFKCSDIAKPVNCTWKYNQEKVPVERIRYRSKSINSTDCTIHVKINESTDEVKGLWECLKQKQNSTQILNVYEAFTNPGTKAHYRGHGFRLGYNGR